VHNTLKALMLRIDRHESLKARWAREALGVLSLHASAQRVPSMCVFMDAALAGLD